MARFALDCSQKMMSLTRKLVASLAPDTADLGLRIGLNSGHPSKRAGSLPVVWKYGKRRGKDGEQRYAESNSGIAGDR